MNIREVELADLNEIHRLQQAWCEEDTTTGFRGDENNVLPQYLGAYFLLAALGEKVVGYILCEKKQGNRSIINEKAAAFLEINDLYVQKEFRGRSIGKKLIRAYEEKDLSNLLEVWYAASQVAHPFLDEAFFDQERRDIPALYLPQAETWVYERDGVVVGFIALIGNEVGAIFVDPKLHGQGIGRALMDKARSLRDVLELDVFKDNLVGRRFYEAYGFRPVTEHVHEETGFVQLRLRLDG